MAQLLEEDTLEDQIEQQQRNVFYDTREYTVGDIVQKYFKGREDGKK